MAVSMKRAVLTAKNQEEYQRVAAESGCTLPYMKDTGILRTPLQIGERTAENRIVYQAMEGCDGTPEGTPGDLTERRYLRFAKGGPGILWVEATAVMREGRANPRQLFLNADTKEHFQRLTEKIREVSFRENGYAPLIVVQLTHSGRYSKPDGTPAPLVAYRNPLFEGANPLPADRVVSDDDLDRVGEALINGAQMAESAGFDGADIKCCHGYLLCELLSAYTREGRYGGSFENRTRLYRNAVAGARQTTGKRFIIASRLNIYDGFPYPYGFGVGKDSGITPDLTEAGQLVRLLREAGLDLFDITMGNPYQNPHVNRPFARGGYESPEEPLCGVERMLTGTREVASAVPGLPVISSGITYLGTAAPHVMAACIKEGWFSMAGFGRQAIACPDIAKRIVSGEELSPDRLCIACSKCTEIMRTKGGTPGCVIRDSETYLPIYRKQCQSR